MQKQLQSNIWKYTLFLIFNKRVFAAVLGAYYLTIPGVGAQAIGFVMFAGSLAGFIFEIPSGYASDKLGHKKTLILSRLFMIVSTLCFLLADNFALLIVGGIFMNLGFSFVSGTGNAFMHETLRALNRDDDYAEVMGKVAAVGQLVPVIFTVLIPFFVSISFKAPFLFVLLFDILGLLVVISFVAPEISESDKVKIRDTKFKDVLVEGHRLGFHIFALFSGIMAGVMLAVSMFRAPYQMLLDIPVIWFGVLFGIGRGFVALLLIYSGRIKKATTIYSFYFLKLVLFTVLVLLLGLVSSRWYVAALFILFNILQWGFARVLGAHHMDIIKTSKFKATLLSITAQIYTLVAAVVSLLLGYLIERTSYREGILYVGAISSIVLIIIYAFIIYKKTTRTVSKGL